MKYLYEGHLGDIYITSHPLDHKSLYCEQCGDSDWLVGPFETIEDFWSLIKDDCDIDGCGGWSLQYIYPMMVKMFNLPDVVEYRDDDEKSQGFCCHSDKEIVARIEELIKESK